MFIIESPSESTVYLVRGSRAVRIGIPGDYLSIYSEKSGLSGEAIYTDLLPGEVRSYSVTGDAVYGDTLAILEMLSREGGYEGELETFQRSGRYLRKSSLDNNIKRFSPGFDISLLIKEVMRTEESAYYAFPASNVITAPLAEEREYIRIWSESVLRNI